MKKIILLLVAAISMLSAKAQIDNGNFESWTTLATFSHPDLSPAGFTSSNNEVFYETGLIPCTEVSGSEGSAVRVETIEVEGEIIPGFGITGNTPEGDDLIFSGGFPFTDINATGMTFDRRYNVGFTSPGFVIVQFLLDGVPVTGGPDGDGTYFSLVLGSQGSWGSTTIDFTANPLTQTPDECIVAFACNNAVDGTGIVGNYLEIDNIVFNGTTEQMPGGDFNTWMDVDSGEMADNWESFVPPAYGFVEQSAVAYEGDFSMRMNTVEFFDDTVQSMIYQAEITEEGIFPNQLLSPDAYALEFYYQYEGVEEDSATVYLVFSEDLDPLPEELGFMVEHLGPTDGWTLHEMDFSEIMPTANYYGIFIASGMGFDVPSEPGSVLWLDAMQILGGEECDYTPTINEGDVSFCPGVDFELTTQEYDSYVWFGAEAGSGDFEEIEFSDTDTLVVEDTESGLFEVYVQTTLDDCVAFSEIIQIEIFEIMEPIISVDGETEIDACAGETVTISLENSEDFENYQWQLTGFDIPFQNGTTYDALAILELSGSFTVEVTTEDCPDLPVVSQEVIVNSHLVPEPTISQDGNTLETETGMDAYQWFLDGEEIDGATSATYEATEDGSYTVIVVSDFDCSGISEAYNFTFVGVEEYASELNIYPNPVQDQLILSLEGMGKGEVSVVNLLGQTLINRPLVDSGQSSLDCSGLENGTYLLQIQMGNETIQKTFIVQR